MNKTSVSAFGFILLMFTAAVWAAPVPDSGQTKCYNNTVEIPCPSPGQPFYGQAANYDINLMSYTKLDSSGHTLPDTAASWSMVKDNVTGLIWENKTEDGTIHNKNNTFTWYDTTDPYPGTHGMNTKYFIDSLNSARFGGYGDWRMPDVKELGSLISYDIPGQNVDINYFPDTQMSQSSYYWSSTTYAGHTGYAWDVDFGYGHDGYHGKYNSKYVRAVRGGQAPAPTGCTATMDENLSLHIPYLSYVNPLSGTISLWADFVYEFDPTLILFKLTDAIVINNPFTAILCSESTLSDDFKIHIPDVRLQDGVTHLWVELEYYPALSTDGFVFFVVTKYGAVAG